MTRPSPTIRGLRRFSRLVTIGERNECWPHDGRADDKGYPFVNIGGYCTRAHRLAWFVAHGEWPPDGSVVRHSCDNPPCCNPRHLLLGTVKDNSDDMVERDRAVHPRGEALRHSKLTEDDVRAIRIAYGNGVKQPDLSESFGVTQACISQVVTRKTWSHVADLPALENVT